MSNTDSPCQCLSLTFCFCQTVCVRHRLSLSFTDSLFLSDSLCLCLSETVCISHIQFVSITDSLCRYQTLFPFILGQYFYLFIFDFHHNLSLSRTLVPMVPTFWTPTPNLFFLGKLISIPKILKSYYAYSLFRCK